MAKNKKKIIYLIFTVIIITIMIFVCSTTTHAADGTGWNLQIGDENETTDTDGLVGVLLYGYKAIALVILEVVKFVLAGVVNIAGGPGATVDLSPADIIFGELDIVKIDFFNTQSSSIGFMNSLKTSVSLWYVTIRNISVIILLGILLYVGIRMAISTVASEEAKYKKMFKDWVVSLVLVYILQYIMIIIIDINNALVDILKVAFYADGQNAALNDVMSYLGKEAWSVSFTQGWGCTILYGILLMMTFLFLILYLKRVIITAFLIIISPLITITYSMDKMGDGKSQALNNWIKEFSYNILIQPFHCIIYGALVLTSVTAMATDKSVATLVMSIVAMLFMFKAEDLVKKIFGVQPSSLGSVVAGSAFALTALGMLKKKDKGAKSSAGKISNDKMKNLGGNDYSYATEKLDDKTGNVGNNPVGGNNSTSGNNQTVGNNSASGNNLAGVSGSSALAPKPNGLRRLGKMGGKIAKDYARSSLKVGAAVAGAALGMGTGDAKGAMAGYAAGSSVGKGISNIANNMKYAVDTKVDEGVMASEYLAWAEQQGIDNEEQLVQGTQEIMNRSLEKGNFTAGELKYRQYLDNMVAQYKGGGEDEKSAKEHVLQTIRETQMGIVSPGKHKSTGGYERSVTSSQVRRNDYDRAMEANRRNNGGSNPTMDSIEPPQIN